MIRGSEHPETPSFGADLTGESYSQPHMTRRLPEVFGQEVLEVSAAPRLLAHRCSQQDLLRDALLGLHQHTTLQYNLLPSK